MEKRTYRNVITQDRLKSFLHYCPDSGDFTWVKDYRAFKKGQVAGCLRADGYIKIAVDEGQYVVHRLAWLYVHGSFPEQFVDHIDGNKSNNRMSNLRECNRSQNRRNGKRNADSTSPFKGVRFRKNRWIAQLSLTENGKVRTKHLGTFDNAESAARAYDEEALKLFGDFARINFVKGRPDTALAPLG